MYRSDGQAMLSHHIGTVNVLIGVGMYRTGTWVQSTRAEAFSPRLADASRRAPVSHFIGIFI